MRVLLTTDGSLGASAAARTACRVFRAEDRQIELLYVEPEYPPRPAGFDNGSPGRFRVPSGLADAWHILGAAGSELSALGIHAARRAEIGWPPAVIANASADFDVTVVGSQGQGLHSAAGLGPVANHVLHHSTGSVLIGRELRRSGGIRVLLALDGSVASVRALNAVRSLDLHAAEIALIYVAETSWIDVGMERECISCGDRVRDSVAPEIAWDKQVRAHGQRVLGSAREQFVKSYPGVRTQLAEGIPSSEILREAATRDCDLIVLGATGATDLKHELLGSTAHRTAWDANCSVLVVRPTSVRMRETAPEGREMAHARG